MCLPFLYVKSDNTDQGNVAWAGGKGEPASSSHRGRALPPAEIHPERRHHPFSINPVNSVIVVMKGNSHVIGVEPVRANEHPSMSKAESTPVFVVRGVGPDPIKRKARDQFWAYLKKACTCDLFPEEAMDLKSDSADSWECLEVMTFSDVEYKDGRTHFPSLGITLVWSNALDMRLESKHNDIHIQGCYLFDRD